MPPYHFACYKNFVTGLVKVKVNNFETILKANHNYPSQKLKLVLKTGGSCIYLEDDKQKSTKKFLGINTLEKAIIMTQPLMAFEIDDNEGENVPKTVTK